MPATSRAAEGLDRRAFTVAEIAAMQEAGIISEEENFELIEGEIVPFGPKLSAHELVKSEVAMALARACPADCRIGVETSIFLSPDTFVEPDISLYPKRLKSSDVRGPDILLAIEVAASSLACDLGLKAKLYARHGVREYWVIDANERATWIHAGPGEKGWGSVLRKDANETLTFAGAQEFSICLASL